MTRDNIDFAALAEPVARALLGQPNHKMSTRHELRFGNNGSVALKIDGERRGQWFDHEANIGGGVLDLIRHKAGVADVAAIAWLRDNRFIGAQPETPRPRIVATYDYRDASGELVFQVCRFDPKTFRQRRPDGGGGWIWKMDGVDRVPYRLPELTAADPAAPVFIVEGEKDADRLATLGLIATTNPGGAGKWQDAYSTPLRDRDAVILPDNDAAGEAHAEKVASHLTNIARTVRILRLPGLPAKGDVSDWIAAGGTAEELLGLATTAPLHGEPAPYDGCSNVAVRDTPPDWDDAPPEHDIPDDPAPVQEGVIPLGHDHGIFYYLSRAARQVYALSPQQHTEAWFTALASVPHHWARSQFVGEKGKIDWRAVADSLMRQCRDIGIYDPERIRGRGAWFDDGRAVLHLGDRLIADGVPLPALMLPGSRFVYEAGLPMLRQLPESLDNAAANRLVKICASLQWERPIYGTLLAGFLAVAPICGGLSWRPSIWLTGESGAGKSWVYENIVAACLRGVALFVQSKTSEAGIRQRLGSDARPVAFDEAEAEDAVSQQRLQAVLDLIRQSASESGGEIVKGTATHFARSFRVRSCFALVSINVSLQHAADESRISVLTLRKLLQTADAAARFADLNALVQDTLTPTFAAALVARSARLLPVIRANAETFARAVALRLGSRRAGDQLGALLAGAYSLHSDTRITAEAAADYVARQAWDAATPDAEPDERRLLAHLTQHRTRVAWGNGGATECTVGRLIHAALGRDEAIPVDAAERTLREAGLRTDPGGLFVSNTHPAIAAVLRGTPWSAQWARALRRVPGAEIAGRAVRFGPGHQAKAVFLPLAAIDGD